MLDFIHEVFSHSINHFYILKCDIHRLFLSLIYKQGIIYFEHMFCKKVFFCIAISNYIFSF